MAPDSPIDPAALQFALPPEIHNPPPIPSISTVEAVDHRADPYETENASPYYEEPTTDFPEADRVPLTARAAPISGALAAGGSEAEPRTSFQTVSSMDNSQPRPRNTQMLGYDLEPGFTAQRQPSYGQSLTPERGSRRSRSPSTGGALFRAGSVMRAMSQRVVNLGGEGDSYEQQRRRSRSRSRSPSMDERFPPPIPGPMLVDTSYPSQVFQASEKGRPVETLRPSDSTPQVPQRPRQPINPLKGKSLGIFGPENRLRKKLCDLLVLGFVEPVILVLIILQTVLLAVEAGPNVFTTSTGHRPDRWGSTPIDWAIFGIFVVFTIEILARVIVSGFIFNAPEYSTMGGQGFRQRTVERYRVVFQPQRQKSVKATTHEDMYGPSTFKRSFTAMQGQALPETVEEQVRFQLARRAFLRHGWTRVDFVAVVAFWISFVLGITGLESRHHLYVFRMLSCLRILRLLVLTRGTAIILKSLKKSFPLLLRVSFLIAFAWVLFAIVGVQSFKSSLSRQCWFLDPLNPNNFSDAYLNPFQFCGGHRDNGSDAIMPWVSFAGDFGDLSNLSNGSNSGKGFICPQGSLCLQTQSPYNGTVNFDNIINSLELVFVIMSANTFTDLMYYTTNSDFIVSALFFAAGIMILMLWMINLLIAVIVTSFGVIREETQASAFTADEEPTRVHHHADDRLHRTSGPQKIYNKTYLVWVLLILFDLVVQAFRTANMSSRRSNFIHVTEIIVTLLLDAEIVIRFVIDFRCFHRHKHNLFDLGLAIVTSVILIPVISNSGQVYAWLSVFQILRIYRVVMAIPITNKLIKDLLGNSAGILNLIVFVYLVTFLVAIFAVQLFRGELPMVDSFGNQVRIPFYNIYNSFLGMYQILSSENWTDVLYHVTGFTTANNMAWIGAMFLIGWFILSFFILVNMFIAVIQENFDVSEDVKRLEQVKAFIQRKELGSSSNLALSTIFSFGRSKRAKDPLDYGPAMMEMLLKDAVVHEFLNEPMDPLQQAATGDKGALAGGQIDGVQPGIISAIWGKFVARFSSREPNPFYSNFRIENSMDAVDPRQMARQAVSATAARKKAQREYLQRHPLYNKALFIFGPKNHLRRWCQRLVGPGRGGERIEGVEPNKVAWYTFSALIYAAIVAMVILACITTPLYQKEYFTEHHFSILNWFVWTDVAFAAVFTIEALIKVVADGFFWTPNAYFRSSWGIIDAIVLITLWINVVTLILNDGAVSRAVGAFKALRALRLLNVSDSARETFHSLIIMSGWKFLSAAFVSMALLVPFAIYGVNLFNGQLSACNDNSGAVIDLLDCQGEYGSTPYNNSWPILAPRVAQNPYFNFDDFPSSLFILFQIVSQEGWVDVSFALQSIVGRGLQPVFLAANGQPGNALFLVVFNLMATVFILTLFISIFMRNYTELTGVAFLTADQRSWLELRKLLRQISPSKSSYDESKRKWKKWCHKRAIEKRGKWYTFITCVLIVHLILLLSEYATEPAWWTKTRDVIFLVFTLTFIANIVIRIIGLGWTRFRRSSWDLFSLVAVTGAFATSILFLTDTGLATYIQLHKFFLVSILLLLIPRNDALDQLFKTAAASLTTILNLLTTWVVFFVMFAIVLTQTFSLTRFGSGESNNLNLRTVPNALILLFRMSFGEGWNQIMADFASVEPPFCVEDPNFLNSDCGSTSWSRAIFIAWNILSMYIFVSLFTSLIFESFSYVYQRSSGLVAVDRDEIRRFKEAWRSVDPAGTGYISPEAFPRLLGELSGVFEMRIYDSEDSVRSILDEVQSSGGDTASIRHQSIASASNYTGVNLAKLNERLAKIDVHKVRERRRMFNNFYEEVRVAADPTMGISFTTVLMVLAHYKIITDSKSLRLEEFLRRRARLQRVEEEVRRRIVQGFFDTV
jgi:voltage-dependent calcium channel